MIPLRLWLYGAAAVVLLAGLGYVKHLHGKAAERDAAVAQARAAERRYTDLQALHAVQIKKAEDASNAYQSDLQRLERERSQPVPVVRLCRSPATVPAPRPAASGSDAAEAGHVGEAPAGDSGAGPDIGQALIEYGLACEANGLQLDRLQEWVRSR
jgi:hypothetical protein